MPEMISTLKINSQNNTIYITVIITRVNDSKGNKIFKISKKTAMKTNQGSSLGLKYSQILRDFEIADKSRYQKKRSPI